MCTKSKAICDSYIQETKGNDDASIKEQEKIQEVLRKKSRNWIGRKLSCMEIRTMPCHLLRKKLGINGFKYTVRLIGGILRRGAKSYWRALMILRICICVSGVHKRTS